MLTRPRVRIVPRVHQALFVVTFALAGTVAAVAVQPQGFDPNNHFASAYTNPVGSTANFIASGTVSSGAGGVVDYFGVNSSVGSFDQSLDGPFPWATDATWMCCWANISTNANSVSINMRRYHGGTWSNPSPQLSITFTSTGLVFGCDTSHTVAFSTTTMGTNGGDLYGLQISTAGTFSGSFFQCRIGTVPH